MKKKLLLGLLVTLGAGLVPTPCAAISKAQALAKINELDKAYADQEARLSEFVRGMKADTVMLTVNGEKKEVTKQELVEKINNIAKERTQINQVKTMVQAAPDDTDFPWEDDEDEDDNHQKPQQKSATRKPNPEGLKDDLAGELPKEVLEVVDFLKAPAKYARMGAEMPKGLLLYGPPGTGKTTIARSIAKNAGCGFIAKTGSDFAQKYVGEGGRIIREVFAAAREAIDNKKHKAVIIFIDEIDAVGGKRSEHDSGASRDNNSTLNQLLTEMDGFRQGYPIVVIGSTNRMEMLDEALLRPGRFDRKIEIGLPDVEDREAILRHHVLKNRARSQKVRPNINYYKLAKYMDGFSAAEIKAVTNEAAIFAVRGNANGIYMKHFWDAIAKVKKDKSDIEETPWYLESKPVIIMAALAAGALKCVLDGKLF